MPKVKVRFFAWLKERLQLKELFVEAKDISDLFEALKLILGPKFEILKKENLLIGVNNKIVDPKERISLNDGDIIDIMPLGAGG